MPMLDLNPELIKERIVRPFMSKEQKDNEWRKPKSHHGIFGHFENPGPSARESAMPEEGLAQFEEGVPESVKRIKVVEPDFARTPKSDEIQVTWLGHAGVLIILPPLAENARPVTLLIDPIFSERASPVDVAGPVRMLGNPCSLHDIPQIDFLFISHNHYDHMDADTLMPLIARQCRTTRFVVPLGVKKWFVEDGGVPKDQIEEMDWWEEELFGPGHKPLADDVLAAPGSDAAEAKGQIKVACVPAQHASARAGIDANATLWAGFVVEQSAGSASSKKATVYMAGDTGFRGAPNGSTCPAFKLIGEKYGPMAFSAIPIWRGGTLSFVSQWGIRLNPDALTLATHATPLDAVLIAKDVKSKSTMGIHFATFVGSEDEGAQPISLLEEACRREQVPTEILQEHGVGVSDIGETLSIPIRR